MILSSVIKGDTYLFFFNQSQMGVNSVFACYFKGVNDHRICRCSQPKMIWGLIKTLLCGLITETHTVTCSLILNLTGCSQSR